MGIRYNKNVLYPRPITLAKRYMRVYRCHGPYMFDKLVKFFLIFNTYKRRRIMSVAPSFPNERHRPQTDGYPSMVQGTITFKKS